MVFALHLFLLELLDSGVDEARGDAMTTELSLQAKRPPAVEAVLISHEGSGKALLVQVALLLQALDEFVTHLVGELPALTLLAYLLGGMLSVGAVGGEA